ncbi:MAG: ATP phosphoribosyltransferase [Alcanivorax sp.]|nr:ATP phosphoribosyltransferase [Alcanivorax sp.]
MSNSSEKLTLALAKGRILDDTLPLLAKVGIHPRQDLSKTRELRIAADGLVDEILIVRSTDVPTYVEHGAADVGIAGKDVLLEHRSNQLYERLDLNIARCRLCLAGTDEVTRPSDRRLRIATKYVNITRDWYASRGEQVELIKLYGSMELAPLVGLADLIVDLVDTGNTLKANGLKPLEDILQISSRLVVNKAAMKMKHAKIRQLIDELAAVVEGAA